MHHRVVRWTLAISLFLPAARASGSWAPNGNWINPPVFHDEGVPIPLSLAPDGRGGVYIASGYDINSRLTRILDTGALAPGWSDDGLFYFDGGYWPVVPVAMSDNEGGVYVISSDLVCFGHAHCVGNATYLRAHHAILDGTTGSWPREGIPLGSGLERAGDRRQAVSIPSGLGSVLTTWADPVGDYHYLSAGGVLRAQRVDFTGELPWGPTGVVVRSTLLRPLNQTMAPDGTGGAYVFWQDDRSPGIYGQHISADGRALWTADGIPIALSPLTDAGSPVAVSDGSHGAIVAWSGNSGSLSGIFAARITPNGVLPSPQGQQVFASGDTQVEDLRIIATEPSGAILGWRSLLPGAPDKILAQHLDHAAHARWSPSGIVVSQAQGTKHHLAIASDLRGGVYLAWIDSRPDFSIYGLHLDRSGQRVQGWSIDGEPICARLPLTTTAGGTATVSDLQLTTVVESAKPLPSLADRLKGRRDDAGAMVVWVDDRSSSGIWNYNSPFAMLLTPHGLAAPPPGTSPAPVSSTPDPHPRPDAGAALLPLAIAPNGSYKVRVQLPDASDASLELFDLAGRKVWARELAGLGPGSHDVPILAGPSLPSGVYMARLIHGAQATSARLVIFH